MDCPGSQTKQKNQTVKNRSSNHQQNPGIIENDLEQLVVKRTAELISSEHNSAAG